MSQQQKQVISACGSSANSGSSSTSINNTSNSSSSIQKYEVLYYKRTNKVHKSKGVSRLDGILTIHPPPANLVMLHPNCADESDKDSSSDSEEEETSGKLSYNQKMKNMRKKMNKKSKSKSNVGTQALYSAKNADIVKRIVDQGGSLCDDDIVVLPAWECQIVSAILSSTVTSKSMPGKHISMSASTASSSSSKVLKGSNKFLGKKRPLASNSFSSSANSLLKRKAPLQPVTANNRSKASHDRNVPVQRKPPTQPKVNTQREESDDNNNDNDDKPTRSSTTFIRSSIPPSLLKQKHISTSQRSLKVVPTRTKTTTTNATISSTTTYQNDECFKGAIGNLYVPSSIKSILRPHQQSGIVFLWNCITGSSPKLQKLIEKSDAGENPTCSKAGAILADEMGLGKTLMTISIIVALHRRNRNDRFIVVCPSSLVMNWAKEFDKFVGKASKPKRVVVRKGGEEGKQKIKGFIPLKQQHSEVLIISYDLFRINSALLSQSTNIGLLVVDEGHRLKNTSGTKILSALNALKCSARLLLSGTPIQNDLSEFYNVANFVLPGILGDLNRFRREIERPISDSSKKDASESQKEEGRIVSKLFDKITGAFMIRRLQKDILKTLLPPRHVTLLFCRPSAEQCRLYKKLTAGAISDSLSTLTKLRKLCSHPDLLNDPCTSMTKAGVNRSENVSSSSQAGKLDVLEGLLSAIRTENPTDKVIIVSNFTTALTIIEDYLLKKNGWTSVRLDGTTEQSTRQTFVDSFNRSSADNGFLFLLSSKAGGCGLNLIGANRLIMYDLDWNPSTDQQAMARIYRQGQKKECFIYRLLTTGTVEEVIFQRQTQKSLLDTIASKKARGQSASFTDEELKDCFTLKEQSNCDTKHKIGSEWDNYAGVDSLLEQDVSDKPLLKLARDKAEVLTYVHLVKDSVSITTKEDDTGDTSSIEEFAGQKDEWNCFDEDSEAEFEG